MRKFVVAGVGGAIFLSGCATGNSQAGVFAGRKGPDELAVTRSAPLVIPPDFALVPPRPGAPRPQEADSSTQALQALFGGPAPRSAGETGLLDQTGAGTARDDAAVRSQVNDPATTTVDKGAATRDILTAPASNGREAQVSTTPPPR